MKVRFYNPVSKLAMNELNKYSFTEVKDDKVTPDIAVARSAELHNNKEIENSVIVARAGVGVNNIPVAKLTSHLVNVTYAPGGNADSVAELTVCKILEAAKNEFDSINFVKTFKDTPKKLEDVKSKFKGVQLKGAVACVYGLGNIGARVTYLLSKFGMKVYVLVRDKEKLEEYVVGKLKECNKCCGVEQMLGQIKNKCECFIISKEYKDINNGCICVTPSTVPLEKCDFLTFHIGDQKKAIADATFLKKLKKDCCVINADRGELINEKDMLAVLKEGHLKYYITDFAPADLELRTHNKVLSSPHTAASTDAAEDNCAVMVAEAIVKYVFDGIVINSKNFPTFTVERQGPLRVCIIHPKAEPALDKVEGVFKTLNLHILNKSVAKNADIFYVVYDVKGDADVAKVQADIAAAVPTGKVRALARNEKYESEKVKAAKGAGGKKKVYNFFAGPAIIPAEVNQMVIESFTNYKNSGMSIAELSHRIPEIENMMADCTKLLMEVLKVPKEYEVMYLGGGATAQFALIPMNLSAKTDKLAYAEMGAWSEKFIEDSKTVHKLGLGGEVVVVASGKKDKYQKVPEVKLPSEDFKYCAICDNETIHGIEFKEYPHTGKVPLIIDASSNILSKPIPWDKYNIGCVFAGAQKNMGMAGVTVLIIRKDLIDKKVTLPNWMKFSNHIDNKSLYNTPPVVPIYSVYCTLQWVKNMGGVEKIQQLNQAKADYLYNYLDNNNFYNVVVKEKQYRSNMNICFTLKDTTKEGAFFKESEKRGLVGLKGHRSVGGARASVYNGLPLEGIVELVEFMKEFAAKNPIKQ